MVMLCKLIPCAVVTSLVVTAIHGFDRALRTMVYRSADSAGDEMDVSCQTAASEHNSCLSYLTAASSYCSLAVVAALVGLHASQLAYMWNNNSVRARYV